MYVFFLLLLPLIRWDRTDYCCFVIDPSSFLLLLDFWLACSLHTHLPGMAVDMLVVATFLDAHRSQVWFDVLSRDDAVRRTTQIYLISSSHRKNRACSTPPRSTCTFGIAQFCRGWCIAISRPTGPPQSTLALVVLSNGNETEFPPVAERVTRLPLPPFTQTGSYGAFSPPTIECGK